MSTVPKVMKALVIEKTGTAAVKEVPVPSITPTEILVKVQYAASNPTDYKHLENQGVPGSILGLDYYGQVVSIGPKVSTLKIGDNVAGVVHGGKFPDKGSYAQYLKTESDMCWKVPEGASGAEISTFGVAYVTAAECIFHQQRNSFPPSKRNGSDWFLIQGGSSSVGLFAIQLAKLVGYKVAATCSPHSYNLVKSYGADAVFDYHNPDKAVKEIKEASGGGVVGALECIGGVPNGKLAVNSFGAKGGLVTALLAIPDELNQLRPDVKVERIVMYTIFGYSFVFLPGQTLPHKPEDHAWYQELVKETPELVSKYGVRGNPVDLRHGLDKVLEGFEELKTGKVSGKKLVYEVL